VLDFFQEIGDNCIMKDMPNKRIVMIASILLLVLGFLSSSFCSASSEIEVYFSPNGGAAHAIIKKIESAEKSIAVAMYAFTSGDLAKALVKAHEKGIDVRILLDGDFIKNEYSKHNFLSKRGVSVRVDKSHVTRPEKIKGYMHHKFAIIDNKILITGSYNWTASAEEKSDENLLIFNNAPDLVKAYKKEFDRIWHRTFEVEIAPTRLVIEATDLSGLKKHAGETATVRGKVYDVYFSSRSGTYFVNFGPERTSFTAVIFSSAVKEFIRQGIDPQDYEGKLLEIDGQVINHPQYGLEIILEDPIQVRIIEH
jgi:hypothetical protein